METKKTIGELIELEVRKQELPILEFAEKICCKRNNVYNIFNRTDIDISLLKRISKVLHRNFFKDLADDLELIEDSISEYTLKNEKAVGQFFNVVPSILKSLNVSSSIVFCKFEEDEYNGIRVPEFGLPDYSITFTIGDTLKERIGDNRILNVALVSDSRNNCSVELCQNLANGYKCINVKLDYKTEEEWNAVLSLAIDTHLRFNMY